MEGIRDMASGSMVTAEDNYNSACDSKWIIRRRIIQKPFANNNSVHKLGTDKCICRWGYYLHTKKNNNIKKNNIVDSTYFTSSGSRKCVLKESDTAYFVVLCAGEM